jgi:predicted acyltransferase
LGYWAVLYLFGQSGGELEMATNAVTRLDLSVLGNGHIYKRDMVPFDPEGILSTLPAIVNVIAGFIAGTFIQRIGKSFEGIAKLLLVGFLLMALARWWDLIFPICKKLWTGSFVLYTVGIDLSIMAVLIYFIELKQKHFGVEFCTIFGKNPLFIYLFSELFFTALRRLTHINPEMDVFEWFSECVIQRIFPGSLGSFVTAILFMLLCWLVGWWLNKKRIYIRI